MRLISTLVFLAIAHCSLGQQFMETQSIALADSISAVFPSGIDLDNDGLPDVALLVETLGGKNYLMHIKGDTLQPMEVANISTAIPAFTSHLWYDYDNDNQLDLILSPATGDHAIVMINKQNFAFNPEPTSIPRFQFIHFADLDSDGTNECIWSGMNNGSYSTKTFQRTSGSTWAVTHDTLNIRLSEVKSADFNNDGFEDLFMSGVDEQTDSVFSRILLYENGKFAPTAETNMLSKASLADINLDGFMDVVQYGHSFKGEPGSFILRGGAGNINIVKRSINQELRDSYQADFNSDGKVDEIALSVTTSDTLNILVTQDGASEELPHKHLLNQFVMDLEHDGDLDLIQLVTNGRFKVVYFINSEKIANKSPEGRKRGLAFPIYDHVFFYWEKATDDHTPASSISYDFYLESSGPKLPAEFDLLNGKRLATGHGNNTMGNFKLVRKFSSTGFNYAIQSVDNALHAGAGGVCIGSGAGCVRIVEEVTSICSEEQLNLRAASAGHWFSLSQGHLADGSSLNISLAENDTVFYVAPNYEGCTEVKVFPIRVGNISSQEVEHITACEGSAVDLASPAGWTNISWRSESAGELGSGSSMRVIAHNSEVVIASSSKSERCTYEKEYRIVVSKPVVIVQPPSAKITPGAKVTLSATGADQFEWSPSSTLSNPEGANTVASPFETTNYLVTGYDSIGCKATGQVTVVVESGAGFVPSLFTPNSDGTNDELRVYGLSDVKNFNWKIYNREGNVVFSTRNISEATSRGWDGTANGVRQPNGVYFWKVEGARQNGELLLNGKKEGSFLLIR